MVDRRIAAPAGQSRLADGQIPDLAFQEAEAWFVGGRRGRVIRRSMLSARLTWEVYNVMYIRRIAAWSASNCTSKSDTTRC
jgi:hypothetical protein